MYVIFVSFYNILSDVRKDAQDFTVLLFMEILIYMNDVAKIQFGLYWWL